MQLPLHHLQRFLTRKSFIQRFRMSLWEERCSLRSGLVSPELHVSAGVASAGVGLLRFKSAEFPHRLSSDKMQCVFLALKNEFLYLSHSMTHLHVDISDLFLSCWIVFAF